MLVTPAQRSALLKSQITTGRGFLVVVKSAASAGFGKSGTGQAHRAVTVSQVQTYPLLTGGKVCHPSGTEERY